MQVSPWTHRRILICRATVSALNRIARFVDEAQFVASILANAAPTSDPWLEDLRLIPSSRLCGAGPYSACRKLDRNWMPQWPSTSVAIQNVSKLW